MNKIRLTEATGLDKMRFSFGERGVEISRDGSTVSDEDLKAIEAQYPDWIERIPVKAAAAPADRPVTKE